MLRNDQVMLFWKVLKPKMLTVENLQQPQVLLSEPSEAQKQIQLFGHVRPQAHLTCFCVKEKAPLTENKTH